jgi:hypothetical protein
VLGEVPFEKGPQPQIGLPTGNRHDVPSKTYLKTAGRESSRAVASLSYRSVPGTAELWLIALRGLPWGEAALDTGVAMIEQQRVANGPSSLSGRPRPPRAVARSPSTGTRCGCCPSTSGGRVPRIRAAGEIWQDSGYVFTTKEGRSCTRTSDPPLPPPRARVESTAGPAA